MSRPYEAMNLRRRYLWAAACRERLGWYWPGQLDREHRTVEHRMESFRPRKHATQEWFGGTRFFRPESWQMAKVRG
jgi:hypothetical protein